MKILFSFLSGRGKGEPHNFLPEDKYLLDQSKKWNSWKLGFLESNSFKAIHVIFETGMNLHIYL